MRLILNNLGSAQPVSNQWITISGISIEIETFRIVYSNVNYADKVIGFAWLRSRYFNEVSRAIRLYPSETPQIINLPYPEILKIAGDVARTFEVRKGYRRGFRQPNELPNWSLLIQEVLGVQND